MSLKDVVRSRILNDMVGAVQPANKWKILVVDGWALRILGYSCKMVDILEGNVTLVEDIFRKRQPFPQTEAIYFLAPNAASIEAFVNDFADGKQTYSAAHLFFTSVLPDDLFDKIKPVSQHLKTLKELYVDINVIEHQVFTTDTPEAFFNLYGPQHTEKSDAELQTIARKLVSAISGLQQYPSIRYFDLSKAKKSLACKLATYLQTEVDAYAANDSNINKSRSNLNIVIVERSLDVLAPLLHEFTYQCMVHDLLAIDQGKLLLKSAETEDKKASATLDENDPIWMLIRHWHYADAVEYISQAFTSFISNNKAATAAMGSPGKASPQGVDALNSMKDTLGALPEFQEMKAKYSVHINICQECKDMFAKRQLEIVASVEQDLATGETPDGRKPKNLMMTMLPLFDDPQIPTTDKIRLLMLYIISQEGIHDSDRKRILEQARISTEDAQAITNLSSLGVRLTPSDNKKPEDRGPYTYFGKKSVKTRKSKKSDAMTYDLSRYVPLVKFVMEDIVKGALDKTYFPYVKEGVASSGSGAATQGLSGTGSNPWSLRTTRATWSNKKEKEATKDVANTEKGLIGEYRQGGPITLFFVLGGITYSEIRATYEIMHELKRDIIIGSTQIFSPIQFLDTLRELQTGSAKRSEKTTSAALPGLPKSETEEKKENKLLNMFKRKNFL